MALNKEEKQRLTRRVAEIEARTGAEIVTTLVERSDHYPEIPWKAFAIGVALGALLAGAYGMIDSGWTLWSPIPIIVLLLSAGAAPALLTVLWPGFARLFLSRERAAGEARQYAEAHFLDRQLFQTRTRNGVLVLVSLFEHQVVIIPDRGISARVTDDKLDSVIARMTPLLAAGRVADAFEAGLSALEEILRAAGFSGPGGANELPDTIDDGREK